MYVVLVVEFGVYVYSGFVDCCDYWFWVGDEWLLDVVFVGFIVYVVFFVGNCFEVGEVGVCIEGVVFVC